jgi:hypothetical protein
LGGVTAKPWILGWVLYIFTRLCSSIFLGTYLSQTKSGLEVEKTVLDGAKGKKQKLEKCEAKKSLTKHSQSRTLTFEKVKKSGTGSAKNYRQSL